MQTYLSPSFSSAQLGASSRSLLQSAQKDNLTPSQKSAWTAAQDFESVFVNNMIESMFEGVSAEEPFGGGQAETMYRSMILNEYSQSIVKTGGIGIADQVYREILALQEGQGK